MKIDTYPLGELAANAYVVSDSGEAVVIDPADEGGFITEKLIEANLSCKYILATHGHFDHLMGLLELKLNTKAPFLMHEGDLPIIKRHNGTAKYFLKRDVDPLPPPDGYLTDGQIMRFGDSQLEVISSPGHTPGGVCFYAPGLLFSGDSIFAHYIGRTDLPQASKKVLIQSIRDKLLKLPGDTIVYPGHSETTTIRDFIKEFTIISG